MILTNGFSLVLNIGLLKKILDRSSGLKYHQEYLCLARDTFAQPFHIHFLHKGQFIKDITNDHVFTGYSPLIISLYDVNDLPAEGEIVFYYEKDAIAKISMKLVSEQQTGDVRIFHYEGIHGTHHFLNTFHQFIISQKNRLYNRKKGNVYLHSNLYKQVQVAYSVPRTISLVTVSENDLCNLFPTDLHGPVGENYYLDSLRHEGKACTQVLKTGKMLLSEVEPAFFKTVYSLGKNHMQPLKPKQKFPFSEQISAEFGWPIPLSAVRYRELVIEGSFIHGIHRIFLFRVIGIKELKKGVSGLAHIHNVYASWRQKEGLGGNFLLR
jgi:hypothetical protein